MDILKDILNTQKLARDHKIESFRSLFAEEEKVAVKQANTKAQQVDELEKLKAKHETELEALKNRHERTNDRLKGDKDKESENVAIQKTRDADRKANESIEESVDPTKEYGASFVASAKSVSDQRKSTTAASKKLKDVEKSLGHAGGGNGLTPDDVKSNPKWKAAKKDLDTTFKKEQDMNKKFLKVFGKELKDFRNKDRKGYMDLTREEVNEGKYVSGIMDIINVITKKVATRLDQEYTKNPERGLSMINTIGAMIGHKVTDQKQDKGKLFLKFGEELEEGKMQDAIKKMKGLSKKQMEFLMTIPQQQLTVIAQQLAGLTMGEELEERHADVMRKRNQSQQKAHQKAMMKSAKKSIKDYDAKNKNKNEESEVEEDRDYKKEYESYHKDPEQIKRRAKRNEARRSLKNQKKLTADKDVHHKDNNPMNNDKSNLSIVTQNYNRKEPRMRDKLKEKGCLPNAKRK